MGNRLREARLLLVRYLNLPLVLRQIHRARLTQARPRQLRQRRPGSRKVRSRKATQHRIIRATVRRKIQIAVKQPRLRLLRRNRRSFRRQRLRRNRRSLPRQHRQSNLRHSHRTRRRRRPRRLKQLRSPESRRLVRRPVPSLRPPCNRLQCQQPKFRNFSRRSSQPPAVIEFQPRRRALPKATMQQTVSPVPKPRPRLRRMARLIQA